MDILNTLFNSDGTIVDSIVIGSAKTIASSTKVTAPGTYVLPNIAKADGYPEDFTGKCLLVVSGTTQPMATTHVLFANSKLWSRASASDEWSRADSAFSEEELTQLAKVSAVVNSVVDSDNKVKTTALPDAVLHNKGAYASLSEMPTENVAAGDYCINTSTDTVCVYDADTNAWTDKLSDKVADLADSTTIYLNASTGDDTLDYGRGLSEDKPFKTLAAALDYGLNKFYRNNTFLTFQFAAGTYNIREQTVWFGSLTNASNIAFRGTGADTIIETEGVDFSGAHNVLMSNVFFKIYSSAGDYGIRMLSAATVSFQDYVGVQIMSEATDVKAAIGVLAASTLSCSSYGDTPYTLEVILGIADIPVFKCDSNASFLMQGPILILSGQSASCVVSVELNSLALIYWNAQTTFNAVPKQLIKVTKNSTFVSYASTLASLPCSGTPVTVDDSSTYTGSAKSPNYNAAIRVNDVTNWESTAQMHNNIYRGANLLDGHFSSIADIMTAVRKGDFSDIYVGDYIPASFSCSIDTSVTSTNFRIAAINLLNARSGAWGSTSPNLCIVPDKLGSAYMNSTNTTAGGYVGSYMYKTVLPAYYNALAGSSGKPFYGYIKTTTERLSNGIDTTKSCGGFSGWTGATSSVSDYTNQNLVLLNEPEVYGCKHWSSSEWDAETIAVQLPMFRLNPNTITNNGTIWWWLRAVTGSTYFCRVYGSLFGAYGGASDVLAVRPRFFIA